MACLFSRIVLESGATLRMSLPMISLPREHAATSQCMVRTRRALKKVYGLAELDQIAVRAG